MQKARIEIPLTEPQIRIIAQALNIEPRDITPEQIQQFIGDYLGTLKLNSIPVTSASKIITSFCNQISYLKYHKFAVPSLDILKIEIAYNDNTDCFEFTLREKINNMPIAFADLNKANYGASYPYIGTHLIDHNDNAKDSFRIKDDLYNLLVIADDGAREKLASDMTHDIATYFNN